MIDNSAREPGYITPKRIVWGALLLVVLAGLYWLVDMRWKEVEINTGFNAAARQNPYLAAQQFLTQSADKKVQSRRGYTLLDQLPSTDDTIIITGARYTMSQRRTDQLRQWLEQGGQLIVAAKMTYDINQGASGDLLLDPLGIKLVEVTLRENTLEEETNNEFEQALENQQPNEQQNQEDKSAGDSLSSELQTLGELLMENSQSADRCDEINLSATDIFMDGTDTAISVFISGTKVLAYPQSLSGSFEPQPDRKAGQMLQLNIGQGRLTVLTDLDLWDNEWLGCFDHAYLLQNLTQQSQTSWIVFDEDMPNIMTLLWQNNAALVVSSLVLLSFWLWSQTLQFGVLHQTATTVRRHFMEHIEATARYQWRSGAGGHMVTLLRQQIEQQVARRHENYQQLTEQQKSELIGRLCEVPAAQIQKGLFDPVPDKTDDLIRSIGLLQQLRKHLC